MKKIYLILLSFLLLIPLTVYAKSYEIKDCNLSLELDSSWDVFTRDNIKGNKKIEDYNLTEEDLEQILKDNNGYLDAIKRFNGSFWIELMLSKEDAEGVQNFSEIDEKEFEEEIEKNASITAGIEDYGVHKVGKYQFMMIKSYDYQLQYDVIKYITVEDEISYTFLFQTNDRFTSSQVKDVEKIMDSVEFTEPSNNLILIIGIAVAAGLGIGALILLLRKNKNKQQNNYYNNYNNNNNYNGYYNPNNGYNNPNNNGYNNNVNNNYR